MDFTCEEIIFNKLNNLTFPWSALSEERGEIKSVTEKENEKQVTFLIDPLDATHNAILKFPFFSITVSVFIDGEIYMGWVFDPLRNTSYLGIKNQGAYIIQNKNQKKLYVNTSKKLSESTVGLIRPKNENEFLRYKQLFLGSNKIRCVSCSSLEIVYVASGVYDAFADVSLVGWQKQCDIAAALLILKEAGGYIVDEKGSPINIINPSLTSLTDRFNVIAACSTELIDEIMLYKD